MEWRNTKHMRLKEQLRSQITAELKALKTVKKETNVTVGPLGGLLGVDSTLTLASSTNAITAMDVAANSS